MQHSDLFIEVLGQRVDLVLVFLAVLPEFDLGQGLIGETRGHDKAGMAGGATQVNKASLGQQQHAAAIGEFDLVDLRLDVVPLEVAQRLYLHFGIEMPDVADDGAILHGAHVVNGDHVFVAGRSHEDVSARSRILHGDDLVTLHRRLQGADRIDFGHENARAAMLEAGG